MVDLHTIHELTSDLISMRLFPVSHRGDQILHQYHVRYIIVLELEGLDMALYVGCVKVALLRSILARDTLFNRDSSA